MTDRYKLIPSEEQAEFLRLVDRVLELKEENRQLREILQGLVKNRNLAMTADKPTYYFEQMQPFWKQAEQALKGGGDDA